MNAFLSALVFLWGTWVVFELVGRWDSYRKALNMAWLLRFQPDGGSQEAFKKRRTWEDLLKPLERAIGHIAFAPLRAYQIWIEQQLRRAGATNLRSTQFISVQILSSLLGTPGLSILFGNWGGGFAVTFFLTGLGPLMWLHLKAQQREMEAVRSLPEALELLSVAMEAGLDFGAALKVYVQKGPRGLLHTEFSKAMQDLSTGKTRQQALHDLMERLPFEFMRSPMGTILQGLKLGAGIAPLLKVQAEHLRTLKWEMVQKKAQEAPVKLLFPLLIFIFPTIFIVLFGPFVISLVQSGL